MTRGTDQQLRAAQFGKQGTKIGHGKLLDVATPSCTETTRRCISTGSTVRTFLVCLGINDNYSHSARR
jgi:hypothetical protein